MASKILFIVGDFYEHLTDMLIEGAGQAVTEKGFLFDVVKVPGALEIPQAFKAYIEQGAFAGEQPLYKAVVALGVVIRGETSHYDTLSECSIAQCLRLALDYNVPLGNGILTVENEAQAIARASKDKKNKGGGAADAALALMNIKGHEI